MNILFCGDSGICDGITLSALSLVKHSSEPLHFFILTASAGVRSAISSEFALRLEALLQKKQAAARVTLIDLSREFAAEKPTANMDTRFTPLCMLRLFADRVEAIPDRILYLDTDVLCRGDFSGLYYSDLSTVDILGVPDRYGKWFFGNILRHDYLNSGVMLMNMTRIRENGLFESCRRLCRDKKMFMPDQSALNKLAVKGKVSGKYNCQGRIKKDTVFKHFTTFFKYFPYIRPVTVKPWQVDELHRRLRVYEFDDIIEELQKEKIK